jgi:iron(III) transport system substrate-binding protein
MLALIKDGDIAEWKVPTTDRFPDAFRLGDHAYCPYPVDLVILYNATKLKPEEVEALRSDWKAVVDPRFRGRFAVNTMKCGSCYAAVHMFLDPRLKDRFGPEFIKQVAAQKPAIYGDTLVAVDRVVAGEQDFSYWAWESVGVTKWQQGAPVRWVFPEPTPVFAATWQAVSKHAPHPHAARLFQSWFMSEKGAYVLQDKYGSRPVLRGVPDRREVTKAPWYVPVKTRYDVDFKRWGENYHKDMDLWIKTLQAGR